MAARIDPRPRSLYEDDLHAWAEQQAALLRARRFGDLDLEHLIEEVEDVGASLYRAVRSRVRTIIEHLLKLEYSSSAAPRQGWERTIRIQRVDLEDDLTPSLQARIEANIGRLYAAARLEAEISLREHGEDAAADALPETCPYTFQQITGDWLP